MTLPSLSSAQLEASAAAPSPASDLKMLADLRWFKDLTYVIVAYPVPTAPDIAVVERKNCVPPATHPPPPTAIRREFQSSTVGS